MTYAAVISADNPIRYWRMGESSGTTMIDATSHNNGTYTNSPTLGAAALITDPDTAVSFASASSQYSVVSDSSSTNLTGFSVEFWSKFVDTSVIQNVIHASAGNINGWDRGIYLGGSSQLNWRSDGTENFSLWSTSLSNGAGYHVVVTVNSGGTTTGYTQGVARNSQTIHTLATGMTEWDVATPLGSGGGSAGYMNGVLDELAIYNYILTPTQITNHYNAGLGTFGYLGSSLGLVPMR